MQKNQRWNIFYWLLCFDMPSSSTLIFPSRTPNNQFIFISLFFYINGASFIKLSSGKRFSVVVCLVEVFTSIFGWKFPFNFIYRPQKISFHSLDQIKMSLIFIFFTFLFVRFHFSVDIWMCGSASIVTDPCICDNNKNGFKLHVEWKKFLMWFYAVVAAFLDPFMWKLWTIETFDDVN
jgi:hypothetical protein